MNFNISSVIFEFLNAPQNHVNFILSEWGGHLSKLSAINNSDVYVEYSNELKHDLIAKLSDRSYLTSNGVFFFPNEGGVHVSKKDNCIHIYCHRSVTPFHLFWVLERLLMCLLPAKGYAMVHASAYTHENKSVLTFGFQGSGKSLLLHGMLNKGADYIGDDLVIINSKGQLFHYGRRMSIHPYLKDVFNSYKKDKPVLLLRCLFYKLLAKLKINRKLTVRVKVSELYGNAIADCVQVDKLNMIGLSSDFVEIKNISDLKVNFLKINSTYELLSVFITDYYSLKSLEIKSSNSIKRFIEDSINKKNEIIEDFVLNSNC